MKIFRGVFLLYLASVLLSCDAPRLNPFDPQGEDFKFAELEGNVYTAELPKRAIADVVVTWENQNITAKTDSNGYYKIADIQRINGKLHFEKPGLSKSIISIDWQNKNYVRVEAVNLSSTIGNIDGHIYTTDQTPISNAKVIWKNEKIITKTDGVGYFLIEDIPITDGWIYFEKEGFKADSLLVKWSGQKAVHLENTTLIYNLGNLEGTVVTNDTKLPIGNVRVKWNGLQTTVSMTDTTGKYKFSQIPIQNGKLYFEKDGYKLDSLTIAWEVIKTKIVETKPLEYSIGDLGGKVFSSEGTALENVAVEWKGLSTVCLTKPDGTYKFSQIPIRDGVLIYKKDGFKNDSITVKWSGVKTKEVNQTLQHTHGDLFGNVYYADKKTEGVPNVRVQLEGLSSIALTNDDGYYKFSNIPIKNGRLIFEKSGYNKDTVNVNWASGKSFQVPNQYLEYNTGTITGIVRKDKSSLIYLSGVKVYWKNQNIVKETNTNGEYTFTNVPMNNGYLYFEKSGYSTDSVYIQWSIQNTITVKEVRLNAIPVLDNIDIYSVVANKFPDEFKTKKMNVEAKVSDEENDIDSVFIQCKALNVIKPLAYNISTKNFQRELNTAELNVSYLDEVIGKNFDIVVKDVTGKKFTLGPSQLKRVISQQFTLFSPLDGTVVGSQPTMRWQNINLEFNYKYYIEIYTDEIPATLVWSSNKFSKDLISFTVNTTLSKGDYFWIIWCEDDFRNRASSKPATFTVQ